VEGPHRLKIMDWVGTEILPHEADVRAWLRRTLDPADLEDVIQEAYCRISGLAGVDHIRCGRAYLHHRARPGDRANPPAEGIISGIQSIVARGVADPRRLAISGHSHGAWLGPLVMTRARNFVAASFAESFSNQIVNYVLMNGELNRVVHDRIWGESLYDNPSRYLAASPDMYFDGLSTAILFEGGANSEAIGMLGYPKAASRFGLPFEFVIYPRTGHVILDARMWREEAQRSLDWFRFWLLDEEDPDPSKAAQYQRWRQLREQRSVLTTREITARS
jgi:hypothetical protein